ARLEHTLVQPTLDEPTRVALRHGPQNEPDAGMPDGDRLEAATRRGFVHGATLGQRVARQAPAEVVVEDLDLTRSVEHDRVAGLRVARHVRGEPTVVVARQVWVAPLRGDAWEPPPDQRDEQ